MTALAVTEFIVVFPAHAYAAEFLELIRDDRWIEDARLAHRKSRTVLFRAAEADREHLMHLAGWVGSSPGQCSRDRTAYLDGQPCPPQVTLPPARL